MEGALGVPFYVGMPTLGGPLSTKGGLVFHGGAQATPMTFFDEKKSRDAITLSFPLAVRAGIQGTAAITSRLLRCRSKCKPSGPASGPALAGGPDLAGGTGSALIDLDHGQVGQADPDQLQRGQ